MNDENKLSTAAIEQCLRYIKDVTGISEIYYRADSARDELSAILQRIDALDEKNDALRAAIVRNEEFYRPTIEKLEAENAALREQLRTVEQRGYELAIVNAVQFDGQSYHIEIALEDAGVRDAKILTYAEAVAAREGK